MSLLLLDRSQLEVKSEGETLALYESGVRRGTVPIKLIDRCVIHGAQTRLDSGVLMKLAEAGVSTVLLSPRIPRRVALVLGPQHNDAAVRLAQATRVLDELWCCQWALSLVRAKLSRQCRTLQQLQLARPDARKPLYEGLQTLEGILQSLRDADCPELDRLRGFEGAAARAYFNGLTGVFAPSLNFKGRNRRPPRDPVNVCLSLGYTMLHLQAIRMCSSAGLDPLLGFYHRPAFGRESLASDLIEPLRPMLDLWVWEMLRRRELRDDHFSIDKGACLLGKAGRQVFYAAWEKQCAPWGRWLRVQTQGLARDMRQQGEAWLVNVDGDDEEAC